MKSAEGEELLRGMVTLRADDTAARIAPYPRTAAGVDHGLPVIQRPVGGVLQKRAAAGELKTLLAGR
ncbi:hypothetical protein [Streptomyces sp. NPDC054783]